MEVLRQAHVEGSLVWLFRFQLFLPAQVEIIFDGFFKGRFQRVRVVALIGDRRPDAVQLAPEDFVLELYVTVPVYPL